MSGSAPRFEVPARPPVALLRFLGAAGTVTGSRFLVETPQARVLVDCGLFQGLKPLRLRNWAPFPVEPASIDAVVLTHAHLDHCGYLPALWRAGFRGAVHTTDGTAELARIVLMDSARIQEDDAEYANRMGFSKHHPARPLYTRDDAAAVLECLEIQPFDAGFEVAAGVRATLTRAGHILGSASVQLELATGERVVVSGDLGRGEHPLLEPAAAPPEADALLVESTYGDRDHPAEDPVHALGELIGRTSARGGVVVIPAFAVDRTEIVLLHLRELIEAGRVPRVPIFVDSPMALAALEVYRRALDEQWSEIRPEFRGRSELLVPPGLDEVRSIADSRELQGLSGPAVIVSASGMATGGRVLHHLAARLPDSRNAVALVGFQAAGTRGRDLLAGAHTLKMLGRYVPVRAEVVDLSGFSVHADRGELIAWLARAPRAPETLFVVHGESEASAALRRAAEDALAWSAVVPRDLECVRLSSSSPAS